MYFVLSLKRYFNALELVIGDSLIISVSFTVVALLTEPQLGSLPIPMIKVRWDSNSCPSHLVSSTMTTEPYINSSLLMAQKGGLVDQFSTTKLRPRIRIPNERNM